MPSFLTNLFESLNSGPLGTFKLIAIGYIALLWVSIIIWVTRDALARSNNLLFQAFAILLTIAIPIVGVLLYLIIRPSKTQMERYYEQLEAGILEGEGKEIAAQQPNCERCFTQLQEDYAYCPNCSYQMKKMCSGCKKTFSTQWNMCPYCSKPYKAKVTRTKKIAASKDTEKEDEETPELISNEA